MAALRSVYAKHVRPADFDQKFNVTVIDTFIESLGSDLEQSLTKLLRDNKTLSAKIKLRSDSFVLYSQPVVLLAYLLASRDAQQLRTMWPLPACVGDLDYICSDLAVH